MNGLAHEFFHGAQGEASFEQVLNLSELPLSAHAQWAEKVPALPRGWMELSRVSKEDRIEFTRDFWMDRLPFHPLAHPGFIRFFEQLDDVAVLILKEQGADEFTAEMVYSLQDNSCFFRGRPPCKEEDVQELKTEVNLEFPRDFLSFVKLHNGFGKLSDMGLLPVQEIADTRRRLMALMLQAMESREGYFERIDPRSLVPFFEVIGLQSFQCFYADWYPGSEMGNVYLSGVDFTISSTHPQKGSIEQLAFTSFSHWLSYYLEGMNLVL